MDDVIQVSDLTKVYPSQHQQRALDGISFNIPSGGYLYGLVGPDGAGKTTALRILATVLPLTTGKVELLGIDAQKEPEKIRRQIGYMPQNFSLYPDLTVIENLNFFANINGVYHGDQKRRIAEMLDFTRLSEFTQWMGAALSGGMKKKLALACALIHAPRVLILDEPSTGVDPVSRRELWAILARVVDQGVTIVVSTPYMDEAERCSRVGILAQGKILTSGSPQELMSSLPFQIVEVKALPRKVARQAVSETPQVLSWRPVGDRLRLSVLNPEPVIQSLTQNLAGRAASVHLLRAVRPNMEDVFIHYSDRREEL